MATKLTDFSVTAASNTDFAGVSMAENCPAGNHNNAMRALAAMIAKVNAGTDPVADTWAFGDPSDLTKRVRLDAGNVSPGQTYILKMPNNNMDLSGLGTQDAGDIIYYDGSVWTRLAKGTAKQTLRMHGTAALPLWTDEWELIDENEYSSTATVTYGSLSAYRYLAGSWTALPTSDGAGLYAQVAVGGAYNGTPGAYHRQGSVGAGATLTTAADTTSGGFTLASAAGNGTNEGSAGFFFLQNFNVNEHCSMQVSTSQVSTAGNLESWDATMKFRGTSARDGFRILTLTGTIANIRIELRGMRG